MVKGIVAFVTVLLSASLVATSLRAEEPKKAGSARFEYVSAPRNADGSVRFVVTPEGLSLIELGGAVVAKGR